MITSEVNGFGSDTVPGILGVAYPSLNCNPTCVPTVLDAFHSSPAYVCSMTCVEKKKKGKQGKRKKEKKKEKKKCMIKEREV